MRLITKATLVAVVIAALNTAVITTAQAVEGPYFQDNEERLEEGQSLELTETAKTSLKLETAKGAQVITCTKAKLAAGATFKGSAWESSATNSETIEYTGCTVTGNGVGCKVEGEKITTTALKGTLGYANEKREGPILEIFSPVSGATIAEPTFGGESCKVKSTKIVGSMIGEAATSAGEETKEKELKFTKTEKTIWTESAGKLTSTKGTLEAFAASATEETTDEMDSKQAVAILLQGSPTSLCNTVLTEFITKCNAGTYYPEGEKYKVESVGNFTIEGGGSSIVCFESSFMITEQGKNPSTIGSISLKIAEPTFSECKLNGVTNCTLTSPAAGFEAPPWKGSILWTKSTTIGPNGFITTKPYSIKAKCGAEECSYIGANFGNSLAANVFNANDKNKPEILSPRAQLQFKKDKMKAGGVCSGEVEASGVYGVIPKEEMKNVYLAST